MAVTLLNPGCGDDDCYDCCELPVIDCWIEFVEDGPDILHWEVTGATSAWIIKRCGDYTGLIETRIDLTLTDGEGSGSFEVESGCYYRLHAENECGEVSHLCDYTYLPECNKCDPEGTTMYGTFYSYDGVIDSGTTHYEYYRNSDSVLVATEKTIVTGQSPANHSGFIQWDLETCCWEAYTIYIPATTIRRYELTIHEPHWSGVANYNFPGAYWRQHDGNFRVDGAYFECGDLLEYAFYRHIRVDVVFNILTTTQSGSIPVYNWHPSVITRSVISEFNQSLPAYFGGDPSDGVQACTEGTTIVPSTVGSDGITVEYIRAVA